MFKLTFDSLRDEYDNIYAKAVVGDIIYILGKFPETVFVNLNDRYRPNNSFKVIPILVGTNLFTIYGAGSYIVASV